MYCPWKCVYWKLILKLFFMRDTICEKLLPKCGMINLKIRNIAFIIYSLQNLKCLNCFLCFTLDCWDDARCGKNARWLWRSNIKFTCLDKPENCNLKLQKLPQLSWRHQERADYIQRVHDSGQTTKVRDCCYNLIELSWSV